MSSPPPSAEEDEEDEDEEDFKPGRGISCTPNRRLSPLEIHFSQVRARGEFRDGQPLEESIAEIRAVPCEDESEEGQSGTEVLRLEVPFPPIEVLKWRCKLRDEQTGRPRIDAKSGGELWDKERLFSLDNRRLYCLQKVAARLWPKKVLVDVVELPPESLLASQRQLKKFRTLDRGRSVLIGTRSEEQQLRWSWRDSVAPGSVPAESEPETEGCHVQMRRRPRSEWRVPAPNSGPRRRPPPQAAPPEEPEAKGESLGTRFSWSALLVVLIIYACLGIVVKLVAAAFS